MNTPMQRLIWDPLQFLWSDPLLFIEKPKHFFYYNTKIGRHILQSKCRSFPAASTHWEAQKISDPFLATFWRKLRSSKQSNKILTFQWQVTHRALGNWFHKAGHLATCHCGDAMETHRRHALWDSTVAHQIWGRILRIFATPFLHAS